MAKYKYIVKFSNGGIIDSVIDEEEVFDSEWKAQQAAAETISYCKLGNQIEHMSNPGDYDLENFDDVEVIIEEVDD